MRGHAERPDEVADRLALLECVEHRGGRADNLENDRNAALFAVEVRHGQRDALAVRLRTQDDELARLGLRGDLGCEDFHPRDGRVQFLFTQDFIHTDSVLSINRLSLYRRTAAKSTAADI